MQSVEEYEKKIRWMDYDELLQEKTRLEAFLHEYEEGIPADDPRWNEKEDPDVRYFYSLKYLSGVYEHLAERFLVRLERRVLARSREMTAKKKQ
ncbi:MAG: hypothetical protein IJ120_08400 [Solobacterium sp.]|nr:hypothetical protein [Solobacterium sp.]